MNKAAQELGKLSWAKRKEDPQIKEKQSKAGKIGAKNRWEKYRQAQTDPV